MNAADKFVSLSLSSILLVVIGFLLGFRFSAE